MLGVPLRWRTRIAGWELGVQFVDGSSLRYREIAHPLVRRQLDRIFAFRQQLIAHRLS